MSESIEALTGKSREAILEDLLDSGRSVTPVEYIARTEIIRLTASIAELEKALGWFLSDDRFRVAVGGSPHVVEKMIADARTTLEASERGGE